MNAGGDLGTLDAQRQWQLSRPDSGEHGMSRTTPRGCELRHRLLCRFGTESLA
jgi:hypothetical protein